MSVLRTLPERAFRRRARLVAVVFCALCAGLAVRLFFLQLHGSSSYADRALGQQLRDTVVPADRGSIFSADGVLLAANSSCWTLRASPREMPEDKLALAAHGLAEILELDEGKLLEQFGDRRSNDCLLRYRVDWETADRVRDLCAENGITGIRINQDSRRWYPQGELLASVLGFTNVDNAGVSGLELRYDDLLTGENGVVLTAVNAWGYTLEQSYETERFPTEGDGLRLTIDANIQHYLENALCYAVKEHHVAARAVGIVMDVNTGAVLAMTTTPAYDPNQPRVIADNNDTPDRGKPDGRRAQSRPAAGPADPVAEQGRQRPVRAGQRLQAHHLRGGAGRRSHYQGLQLLLRGVHLGGRHSVPLRQPQAPRSPDRHPGAGKLLQPELHPDRRPAGPGSFLRLLCRLRSAGAHRHRPARRAEKEPLLHRRPHGPRGTGLLRVRAEQ